VWDAALGIAALPLGVLPREESIALLRWFRADLPDADAAAIAAELGDLPLALHLAGSFLKLYPDLSAAEYIAELHSDAILNHESLQGVDLTYSPTNHELHVARTFAASYRRLDVSAEIDALALALLARAAHFAPGEPIPRDLLLATVDLPDKQAERQAQRALRRLLALGLLELDDADAPTLHRLLARFVQDTAADDAAQAAVERVIIDHTGNLGTTAIPAAWFPVLPHLRHATDEALKRADEQAATLANNLGYCLNTMFADYAAARPLFERALAIDEAVYGPDHPDVATDLNNLALLLQDQGDYAAARPLYDPNFAPITDTLPG
jgi:tetratricopeptide (TPR) repeat protein